MNILPHSTNGLKDDMLPLLCVKVHTITKPFQGRLVYNAAAISLGEGLKSKSGKHLIKLAILIQNTAINLFKSEARHGVWESLSMLWITAELENKFK